MLQKDIALNLYNIEPNNLSNKINRNTVNIDPLVEWADHHGVNFRWLLTGKGPISRKIDKDNPDWPTVRYDQTKADEDKQPANQRRLYDKLGKPDTREGILELFNDRHAARKINLAMSKIEQKNPASLAKIEGYIQGIEGMLNDKPGKK